ncbi:sensor histidine kinase [Runella sp.]|uniref:sensor histidine kinase n=1 Tax=Runella sp. TaxID=1960881 RepID=UPI003D142620
MVFAEIPAAVQDTFRLDLTGKQVERLFQISPDLVYIIDMNRRQMVFISKRVEDMLGYSYDDIQQLGGSLVSMLVHPDLTRFLKETYERFLALNEGESFEFTFQVRHKNGSVRTIRSRATVLVYDENGNNHLIMNMAEDITKTLVHEMDLQKKQYQIHETEVIFKCGSWEWQNTEKIIRWSEGLFRLMGLSPEDYPDKCITLPFFESFILPEDLLRVQNYTKQLVVDRRENFEIEHRITDASGALKYLTLRARCYYGEDGRLARVIGVAADRTEIETYQKELERRLVALKKSNQDLEQFAYVASHDLQEPLRKIIAFGERLDKKYKEQLGTEGQFFVERMTNAAYRMNGLIEDLLTYSRVSRQTESHTLISLEEVVKNVMEDLEVKIQDKNAVILIDKLPPIEAQPVQMHQLFLNLIENALKFTKSSAAVAPLVEVKARKATVQEIKAIVQLIPHETYYRISVTDNGIGFEPEYAERIFAIFQRLHGRAEYEGTGLGLAICRKIVETHHGYIEAHGKVGEGAEFIFYLPHRQHDTPVS